MNAALYSITLFASAALLMAVQPMVGRMLLPSLGGSPAVWNTCLVFFQGVLLLGYLYSHLLTRRPQPRRQLVIHAGVWVLASFTLPIALGNDAPAEGDAPIGWLLKSLLIEVGPAFFAVSATAPLLQRWFSRTDHPSANDPYFLYAASNLGSLAMLVAYPLLIEPKLRLSDQAGYWRWAFLGLGGLIFLCGLRSQGASFRTEDQTVRSESPKKSRILRWMLLAFIPSSLLQSITTHITTDIAAMPMLWMAPLGLYFMTFVAAFSTWVPLPLDFLSRASTIAILTLFLVLLSEAGDPLFLILAIHLITFFLICLLCHGVLAKSRPAADHLTGFYLWIALGGVLGSGFNALLAPVIFSHFGLVEYPLMLLAATLIKPDEEPMKISWRDFLAPIGIGCMVGLLMVAMHWVSIQKLLRNATEATGLEPIKIRGGLLYGLPCIAIFMLSGKPIRFALALLVLSVIGAFDTGAMGTILDRTRNYYGTLKVARDLDHRFIRLVHGRTIHGQEWLDETKRREPLTYYHPAGPIGNVMQTWRRSVGDRPIRTVGIVGLGIGSLLGYAKPGEEWTCFELDPAVVELARDSRFFHFIGDSPVPPIFRLGDARVRLREEADAKFDLLILDAFSSDAIPMHLITKEAVELYLKKLAPGGLLAFHISNRYLDLSPVLARIASSQTPPLAIREAMNDSDANTGKFSSHWVVLCRKDEDLAELKQSIRWLPVRIRPGVPLWTDDFANIFDILKWKLD